MSDTTSLNSKKIDNTKFEELANKNLYNVESIQTALKTLEKLRYEVIIISNEKVIGLYDLERGKIFEDSQQICCIDDIFDTLVEELSFILDNNAISHEDEIKNITNDIEIIKKRKKK